MKTEKLYFLGLQNHCRWWLQPWNWKKLAPWKKSYDQPRQHIKKQRHYFADKGPSSQSCGFSSSHVWMWKKERKCGHSVMSDSLWSHRYSNARLPCPSQAPRAHSNCCSLSRWCHPTISSSIVPFSSCFQSFPMSQLFTSGSQSIGVSGSTSVLPKNT